MKKNLKYISVLLLIIIMNSCFVSPINEAPKCSLGVQTNYKTKEPVTLYYNCKKRVNNYIWELKIDAPEGFVLKLETSENGSKSFVPTIPGQYIIYSSIKDEYGAIDKDRRMVNIINNAPTAMITSTTSSQYYSIHKKISLSGSESSDDDGNISKYEWSFKKLPEGSSFFDFNKYGSEISFTPDKSGEYIVLLRVIDNNQASSYASYSFYVNPNKAPEVKQTFPDYNLKLIEVVKGETQDFIVEAIDDNSEYIYLKFRWSISVNNEEFEYVYTGFNYLLDSSIYAISDRLNLKLEIEDSYEARTIINWNLIIVN